MSEPHSPRHSRESRNPVSQSSFSRKRESSEFGNFQEWEAVDFVFALSDEKLPRRRKLQARDYRATGKFPVIDQGQSEIAGWTNDESLVIESSLPYVVFGDHTRTFKYVDRPFVLGADGTQLLKPSADYNPRFFYYACLQLDLPSRGYNRHFSFLKEKSLPLPPKPEQEKIAAVLWKVQRAIATQDRLIAATRDLKASAMQRLFTCGLHNEPLKDTEIGPMPESWKLESLGSIAETTSGGTPNRSDLKYYSGNILWVKSGELNDGYIEDTEEKITAEGLKHSSAKLFQPGTLLMAMYGATVGKTAILKVPAATNQAVCGIFANPAEADSEFLRYSLIYDRPALLSRRYGGAQPNISQTVIRNFTIRCPSLDEQRVIAAALATIDRKLAHHKKKRAALNDLFQTLLHKLMTAEIRVADLDIDTGEISGNSQVKENR